MKKKKLNYCFFQSRRTASSHEPGWKGWPGYRNQFLLGFIWEIPGQFPRWKKRPKILGRVLARNSRNRANMARHKNDNFWRQQFVKLYRCSQWDAYHVENTTGNARRCHPDCKNASRFHPGFHFWPTYRDPAWKNRVNPPSHMNTSKILQRIYVRRDLGIRRAFEEALSFAHNHTTPAFN